MGVLKVGGVVEVGGLTVVGEYEEVVHHGRNEEE
jgi:hypothetical protein